MKLLTQMNKENNKGSFYGNLDKTQSTKIGAWDLAGTDKKGSLISITLDRLRTDRIIDMLAYTFQTQQGLSIEFKELETVRNIEDFEMEKAMLESYERIIKMKDVENISLEKLSREL